jgi:transmembrane sensor
MKTETQITQLLAQRAAEWMEALKSGNRGDRAAFDEWLRDSKRHVEYYLEMEALDRQVKALGPEARPDVEATLAAAASNVRELKRHAPGGKCSARSRSHVWPVAAALAGTAILVAGYFTLDVPRHRIATAVGEQRTLTLSDGSQVRVNVDTELQIDFSARTREIDFISGEAVFKVAADPSRPFIVRTPAADVRAVGTEFNVHHRGATVVSVLEGRVQVTTQPEGVHAAGYTVPAMQNLGAGEEAKILAGRIEKRVHPDVAKTTAWREGRLYCDEMPLDEIIREFNRYGGPVHLKAVGIEPGAYRFGGTFNARDARSLADVLEQQKDLIVERRPGEILIRPRR